MILFKKSSIRNNESILTYRRRQTRNPINTIHAGAIKRDTSERKKLTPKQYFSHEKPIDTQLANITKT